MDGVKTSVRACISNGERGRMMLRVLLCGEGKRGDVPSPPRAQRGGGGWGLPKGNPPAFAVCGCTILEVSAGSGICCPTAVGGHPHPEPTVLHCG